MARLNVGTARPVSIHNPPAKQVAGCSDAGYEILLPTQSRNAFAGVAIAKRLKK